MISSFCLRDFNTYRNLVLLNDDEALMAFSDCLDGRAEISFEESDLRTLEDEAVSSGRSVDVQSMILSSKIYCALVIKYIIRQNKGRKLIMILSGAIDDNDFSQMLKIVKNSRLSMYVIWGLIPRKGKNIIRLTYGIY